MKSRAILKSTDGVLEINRQTTPEFLLLYQQSVLLELKEQAVLNDAEYQLCMDALAHQINCNT